MVLSIFIIIVLCIVLVYYYLTSTQARDLNRGRSRTAQSTLLVLLTRFGRRISDSDSRTTRVRRINSDLESHQQRAQPVRYSKLKSGSAEVISGLTDLPTLEKPAQEPDLSRTRPFFVLCRLPISPDSNQRDLLFSSLSSISSGPEWILLSFNIWTRLGCDTSQPG